MINNAQTHASTLLSSGLIEYYICSKSDLARPGKKGSKMIVLNARDKMQMSGDGEG